ncbi:methanol dehydrogenase [Flavobacterium album]|uniref:Methanol dehydrogenase n=1 Tax=Flavobacterium album TaxID=2175091 RepID=A0A2S1R2T3_9FLAO|nr:methanol dehydrogenase [Flavobacterium album]
MKRSCTIALLIITLLLPLVTKAQFHVPEKPDLQTSVYDYAKILNSNERRALENKLLQYSDSTSTQIVIITIESLQGENIGELTPRWAHQWGIGQADKDNGVLILLAEAEHEIWISPGYGVDDRLTAGQLGQMIRDVIIPEFKSGNYYSGLNKGTDAIFLMLRGKYKAEKEDQGYTVWGFILRFLLLSFIVGTLIMFFAWLVTKLPQSDSTYSSSGKSRHSSSSRSGGFRGGFGGGGFSGGGAGGKW